MDIAVVLFVKEWVRGATRLGEYLLYHPLKLQNDTALLSRMIEVIEKAVNEAKKVTFLGCETQSNEFYENIFLYITGTMGVYGGHIEHVAG